MRDVVRRYIFCVCSNALTRRGMGPKILRGSHQIIHSDPELVEKLDHVDTKNNEQ